MIHNFYKLKLLQNKMADSTPPRSPQQEKEEMEQEIADPAVDDQVAAAADPAGDDLVAPEYDRDTEAAADVLPTDGKLMMLAVTVAVRQWMMTQPQLYKAFASPTSRSAMRSLDGQT